MLVRSVKASMDINLKIRIESGILGLKPTIIWYQEEMTSSPLCASEQKNTINTRKTAIMSKTDGVASE